jgi:hypothetical protein
MAKPRTYPIHRNCGLCGKPVRQQSDFLRAQLLGAAVLFHWSCFIREMRAGDQRNAPGIEVMR